MTLTTVGKSVPQIDAVEKATGRAQFAGDIVMSNMLIGKVLHSPLAHARIVHVDISRAGALPGVKAIVTGADCPARKYGRDVRDENVLARDKVLYVGDEVAAVAAVDEDTAAEAIELIRVEYEELPPVLDLLEAMDPASPLIHEVERNIAVQFPVIRGDVERGFEEARCVLEHRFVTPGVHPAYLEPLSCVASVDGTGRLTVCAGSQGPFHVRDAIADALCLPPGKVRVVDAFCGGGFGGKFVEKPMVICALLAQRASRPVSLAHDRREAFMTAPCRAAMIIDLKMGVTGEGSIAAKQARIVAENGAYTRVAAGVLWSAATRVDSLYRIENIKTDAMLVYTNKPPTSNMRGLGSPQSHFAVESMIDMLADELGMDPAEMRLRNAARTGDVSAHGWRMVSCGLTDCLQRSMEQSHWHQKRNRPGATGIGMGCAIHISGTRRAGYGGASARVKVDVDGTVTVISGETDIGQGSATTFAQIAAEELGARLEDVRVAPIDTDTSPNALGTFGSRVTYIGGNAVLLAARAAKRQLLDAAAEKLEVKADDLEIRDSKIFVRGAFVKHLTIAQVAQANLFRRGGGVIFGHGNFDSDSDVIDPASKYGNFSGAYSFATHVAEVAVDTETGQVDVLNFVAAHDLGRAINVMSAEGQVEGSVAMGIGYGVMEEMQYDSKGELRNPNFDDYRVSTALDMPTVSSIIVETDDPSGPYGAKGVGEIGLIGTAPAIANAVYNAVGVRITDLPVTPEKVLKALRQEHKLQAKPANR